MKKFLTITMILSSICIFGAEDNEGYGDTKELEQLVLDLQDKDKNNYEDNTTLEFDIEENQEDEGK